MKKTFITSFMIFLFLGGWVMLQAAPQVNTYGSAVPILNQTYDGTEGALQAVVMGRGVTAPQTNTYGSIVPIFNQVYDPTLGALQVYLDSSSTIDYTGVDGLTPGSVVFGGSGGALEQDNTNFFWDDTNNRIGIGISTPDTKLDVNGARTYRELSADPDDPDEGSTACWQSDGTGTGDDGDTICKTTAGSVTTTNTLIKAGGFTTGSVLFSDSAGDLDEDNSNLFWDDTDNRLGVGTASPTNPMHIATSGTSNPQFRAGSMEFQTYAVNNAWFGDNIYYDTKFRRRVDGYGTLFYMYNGGFQVRTTPSGTAGAGATLTQRFIIQEGGDTGIGGSQTEGLLTGSVLSVLTNGKVGIENTTPDSSLDVNGAITQRELSADPSDPDEGSSVCWTSDGTGTGIDGEQVCKGTAGGSTTTWYPPFAGTGTEWNDANIGGLSLGGPAAGRPDTVAILATGGAATNIYTLGFNTAEKASGIIEIPHSYKEGTDLYFHVHWSGNDAPSGTDKVKWQLEYLVSSEDAVVPTITTITIETDYDTQYERVGSYFAAITGTTFNIGDQFAFTLERIAASADEYAGDALLFTTGFHFESDTVGSRTITSK